ncbi:hypothetical protein T09_11308 [Trichinella sp. T9]|nr:hypothetical protein T09_11308 [Trichinella sp. T9]
MSTSLEMDFFHVIVVLPILPIIYFLKRLYRIAEKFL